MKIKIISFFIVLIMLGQSVVACAEWRSVMPGYVVDEFSYIGNEADMRAVVERLIERRYAMWNWREGYEKMKWQYELSLASQDMALKEIQAQLDEVRIDAQKQAQRSRSDLLWVVAVLVVGVLVAH